MALKTAMANVPVTGATGARGEDALTASRKLIADSAEVWLVDAADVRGGAQAGKMFCSLTRNKINTVGVFLVRQAGKPDMLIKCSIDTGRLSKTAYGVGLASRFPDITMPNGTSVSDAAAYIKRPENRGANVDILTVAQAYSEWPELAPKGTPATK